MGAVSTDYNGDQIFTDDAGYITGYLTTTGYLLDANGNIVSMPTIANQAAGGDSSALSWISEMIKAVPQVVTGITSYQMAQINLERAKRGQSPLNAAAYGPQVGVGLNAQTMQYLAIGAVGLAAVYLIGNRKR